MQYLSGRDWHLNMSYGMFFLKKYDWWVLFSSENIALNKNAIQSHPYDNPSIPGAVDASNAVDGLKTNFSYFGQQCIVSAENRLEAMWRVDLKAILGIHHITIYYRTDNVPWGKTQILFCIT